MVVNKYQKALCDLLLTNPLNGNLLQICSEIETKADSIAAHYAFYVLDPQTGEKFKHTITTIEVDN